MTTDAVERALAELATRADLHPVPDRVRAVHRRARRNAAVRVAATTLAVATVAAAGTRAGNLGSPFDRGLRPAVTPTPEAPASPTWPPTPAGPYLHVMLERESEAQEAELPPKQPGIPVVVVVYLRASLPVGGSWTQEMSILGRRVDWGDGTFDTEGVYPAQGTSTAKGCPSPAHHLGLDGLEPMTHHYEKPGTYTVTFRATACAPVGEVTATLVVTVREP